MADAGRLTIGLSAAVERVGDTFYIRSDAGLTFALRMAGVALLAPDASTVLAALGAAGTVLFLGGAGLLRWERATKLQ